MNMWVDGRQATSDGHWMHLRGWVMFDYVFCCLVVEGIQMVLALWE